MDFEVETHPEAAAELDAEFRMSSGDSFELLDEQPRADGPSFHQNVITDIHDLKLEA